MKRVFLSILALFIMANVSFATITVQQARSKEQLNSQGYSNTTTQAVQIRSGEYNPTPTNKWQKVGFKIWNYIDPASPQARDDIKHDIKPYPYFDDL